MTDDKTQDKKTDPDGSKDAAGKDKGDAPASPDPKLQAAHDMAQAEARKANKLVTDQAARIKELEAKADETPKEDTERLAALEVEAARSKAALKYGLSIDDAAVLKGTPAEIDADAKYWADKLKAKGVADDTKTDTSNRDNIDQKVDAADPPPKKPPPKGDGNLSWMEKYKTSTPKERYKMDEDWRAGKVTPFK